MKYRFTQTATETFQQVIDFYKDIDDTIALDSDIATNVVIEVNDAISRLLFFPQMGAMFEKENGVRILMLAFHLGLLYYCEGKMLTIIAVVDLRQNPETYMDIVRKNRK